MSQKGIVDLTPREKQIALMVAQGMSNKEIGRSLGIGYGTVKNHLTSIYKKWEINDRTQCAITVLALGWIRPFEAYCAMVGYGRDSV